jgi:hypothetical protein
MFSGFGVFVWLQRFPEVVKKAVITAIVGAGCSNDCCLFFRSSFLNGKMTAIARDSPKVFPGDCKA